VDATGTTSPAPELSPKDDRLVLWLELVLCSLLAVGLAFVAIRWRGLALGVIAIGFALVAAQAAVSLGTTPFRGRRGIRIEPMEWLRAAFERVPGRDSPHPFESRSDYRWALLTQFGFCGLLAIGLAIGAIGMRSFLFGAAALAAALASAQAALSLANAPYLGRRALNIVFVAAVLLAWLGPRR